MGSNRKLEELFREFDAYEDEDLMEAIEEAYKLGCKEGKRRASSLVVKVRLYSTLAKTMTMTTTMNSAICGDAVEKVSVKGAA